ncbi:hypothetical protein Avbf_14405 [Armadillidium vulgare]|nr:hypothetical protein Avbf_14405 [Armadillidium vulgare]
MNKSLQSLKSTPNNYYLWRQKIKEKLFFHTDFQYESVRCETFWAYPSENNTKLMELARKGFFYDRNRNLIFCYFCNKIISPNENWKAVDYHKYCRNCPMNQLPLCDFVLCFKCKGGLYNIGNDDDPFLDHQRFYGHCPYIKEYLFAVAKSSNELIFKRNILNYITEHGCLPRDLMHAINIGNGYIKF